MALEALKAMIKINLDGLESGERKERN